MGSANLLLVIASSDRSTRSIHQELELELELELEIKLELELEPELELQPELVQVWLGSVKFGYVRSSSVKFG